MSEGVDVVVTLHALATYAESANHWTDDKRMMDASGVADTIYEAMDRIEELEAEIKLLQDAVYIDDLTVTMMANDRITHHAKRWLNGPLPADLMADLADILDDEDYLPEKRAHQIVWQALKWMMENPVQKETHNDQR